MRDYRRIVQRLRMIAVTPDDVPERPGRPVSAVYFPNGGVFSVTTEMRNQALIEVATIGIEGMLGIGVFLGDRVGVGRTFARLGL